MKTTMITKAMMAVVFAMATVFTTNAVEPTKFTNVEMDNDRVSAKVVYEKDGQYLTPEFRFEYQYGADNRVIEKKALKWNGTKWMNYYCISVTYSETEAHMQYAIWDKKARAFRPTEKYVYQLDEAGKFLAKYSYQLDKENSWQLNQVILSQTMLAKR